MKPTPTPTPTAEITSAILANYTELVNQFSRLTSQRDVESLRKRIQVNGLLSTIPLTLLHLITKSKPDDPESKKVHEALLHAAVGSILVLESQALERKILNDRLTAILRLTLSTKPSKGHEDRHRTTVELIQELCPHINHPKPKPTKPKTQPKPSRGQKSQTPRRKR